MLFRSQRFVGRVNYLSRFCSRLADRSLPFFDILRKPKDFLWTEECSRAFEELKGHLATLPTVNACSRTEVNTVLDWVGVCV